MKTARAKGLAPGRVLRHHVLRNALLPVVTLAGLQAGAMVGGAVLIETVFAWPGIGRMLVASLAARDYAMVQGAILLSAGAVLVLVLLADLAVVLLDPRVRTS